MKRMTQKEWKENYCCPVCRGNNIDSGKILGPYEYERICEDCGTEFTEIMSLVGYKVTKKGTIKKGNNMKLTHHEKQLLFEIDAEPSDIGGYCAGLKWDINFGRGVLGSLNKKGLVESDDQYNLQGFGHSGDVDSFVRNHPDTEKFVILGLTFEGRNKAESMYEDDVSNHSIIRYE